MADLRGAGVLIQAGRVCEKPASMSYVRHFYYLCVMTAFSGLGVGS